MFNLLNILDFKKKIFFSILILSSVFASFLEILGIGLLIPIISSLLDNSFYIQVNDYTSRFGFPQFTEQNFLSICLFLLPIVFITKNLFLFLFHNFEAAFIFKTLQNFSLKIYKIFLYQKYDFYLNENSSNFFVKLTEEFKILEKYFISIINFITEFIILIFLVSFLIYFIKEEILLILIIILLFIFIFYFFFYKKIKAIGFLRNISVQKKTQNILETVSGIKEIKIYGREIFFSSIFNKINQDLFKIFKNFYVIEKIPKLFFETAAILSLVIVIFFLVQSNDTSSVIIKITVMSGTLIRILPTVNKLIHSYNTRKYAMSSVKETIKFLNRLKIKRLNKNIIKNFEKKMVFSKVNFKYQNNNDLIFENLNFSIYKKDKISIMGLSGSGKSTFVDIILGFLKSNKGKITIDGKNIEKYTYNNLISYAPQSNYIFDTSIEKNIALEDDIKKIDLKKINKLKKICILENSSKQKIILKNFLGKVELKYHGGQKQRIGIARALYHNPKILILDESFSAIDLETSKKIFHNIVKYYKEITIILITHSPVLAKMNKKIYTLDQKKLIKKILKNNKKI